MPAPSARALTGNPATSAEHATGNSNQISASDRRGARVKASADAGSITLDWDSDRDVGWNHRAAARALAKKLDWKGVWSGGSIKSERKGFVFVTSDFDDFIV